MAEHLPDANFVLDIASAWIEEHCDLNRPVIKEIARVMFEHKMRKQWESEKTFRARTIDLMSRDAFELSWAKKVFEEHKRVLYSQMAGFADTFRSGNPMNGAQEGGN
jgi:hypothetical protein